MSDADTDRETHLVQFRDWVLVFGTGLAVRVAFMAFKGPSAHSWDLEAWKQAGLLIASGRNPYLVTDSLSWPPLWLEILDGLQKLSTWTGVSMLTLVPLLLMAGEGALIAVLLHVLDELGGRRGRALLLVGIAFNPVCIILVTQHGNFDVLVGLLVALFLAGLVRFHRSAFAGDWLLACFWLGLAIALKSVPVLLLPLLLSRARALRGGVRWLGAALALGPTVYGLGVLHALRAANIRTQILGYRSVPSWFGVPGWLWNSGRAAWVSAYSRAFTTVLLASCALLALAAWHGRLSTPRRLFASAGLLLASVPALGPGYGPQYFYWFWPVVLVSFALGTPAFRRLAVIFGSVAAATYMFEYALAPLLGAFLAMRFPATRGLLFTEWPSQLRQFTVARIPLFLAYLALLAGLARELGRAPESSSADASPPDLAGARPGTAAVGIAGLPPG